MTLNFFAALKVYQALIQPLNPSHLPLHTKGYMVNSTGHFIQIEGSIIREKPNSWVEIAAYHLNPSQGFDTAFTYWKLDSSRHVTRATGAMTEGPLENGADFKYESGKLVERINYESGKEAYRTFYTYETEGLSMSLTLDSSSDTVFVSTYHYANGELTEVEGYPAEESRSVYALFSSDSIVIRKLNAADAPSESREVLTLQGGKLLKTSEYDANGMLYHYTEYSYPVSDALVASAHHRHAIRSWPFESYNLLGRGVPR